jgi:ubiquinone/menaquinone biosynthesis C-methylase UbiE
MADRIRLEQCDVHQMPQPDETADLIVSRSTIHHWADPPQAFREVFRLLKQGGVVIIHESRRDPAPAALAEFNRLRSDQGIEPARMDEKSTSAEVRQFLSEAGLHRKRNGAGPLAGTR